MIEMDGGVSIPISPLILIIQIAKLINREDEVDGVGNHPVTTITPLIVIECPGNVHTNGYAPGLSGAIK